MMRVRLRSLGFSDYESYLRSGLWGATRRRLARDRCEVCSAGGLLHLHHMTYARLGAERAEDVCTLCARCHRQAHARALQTGSLYVQSVLRAREQSPAKAKDVLAQRVECPECLAKPGYSCFLPSGNVRSLEHKARRQRSDSEAKEANVAKRRRRSKKSARSRRLTETHAQAIDRARVSEFPLDALRAELDVGLDRSLSLDP